MKNFIVIVRYFDRETVEYSFEAMDAQEAVDAFRNYAISDPHDIVRVLCVCDDWV